MRQSLSLTLSQRLYAWAACMLMLPPIMLLIAYYSFDNAQKDTARLIRTTDRTVAIARLSLLASKKQSIVIEYLLAHVAEGTRAVTVLESLRAVDTDAEREFADLPDRLFVLSAIDRDALLQSWERFGEIAARTTERAGDASELGELLSANKEFSQYIGDLIDKNEFEIRYLNNHHDQVIRQATYVLVMICAVGCIVSLVLTFFLVSALVKKLDAASAGVSALAERLRKTEAELREVDKVSADLA